MSDKPLAERLQVKNGRTLVVLGDVKEVTDAVGAGLPRADVACADVVLLAVPNRQIFDGELRDLLPTLRHDAILWIAYPKSGSGLASNINRDVIRAEAPRYGLDTVSQIAIDSTWSALRLKRVTSG